MALQLSNTYTTKQGFEVTAPFAFMFFSFGKKCIAHIQYYKDEASFVADKAALDLENLPTSVALEYTAEEFFGNAVQLAHERFIEVAGDGVIVTNIAPVTPEVPEEN